MGERKCFDEKDDYINSLELKKMSPQIPMLNKLPENAVFDKQAIMAEIDLIDTFRVWYKNLTKNSLEEYRALAEIYSAEYDNHYKDISTLLTIEGVIVELYSDIFKYEDKKGETEKSKYQKERVLVLKNGFECLKKYITKYEEVKVMLKQSAIERTKLLYENKKLTDEVQRLANSSEF
ncbi:MAG: hypothetical protein JWR05_3512 [Mucilaginibacter sp.]|nr:hypothetical protein [Mucilaginibacter sp.]